MIEAAIKHHFERTIQQEASQEDLAKYTNFMQDGIADSGPYFGLRNALIAIQCSPKLIYRSELGLGESHPDGRTTLSPIALAYALTDQKPDEALLAAVKSGRLNTRGDAKREVTRILDDIAGILSCPLGFFLSIDSYFGSPLPNRASAFREHGIGFYLEYFSHNIFFARASHPCFRTREGFSQLYGAVDE